MNFIKKIICFFVGHDKVQAISEDEHLIYSKKCDRCGVPFMSFGGTMFIKNRNVKPPGTSQKKWDKFMDEQERKFRKKYSGRSDFDLNDEGEYR